MDDGSSLGRISVFVKVGMADACTGFYYRYSSILPYKVNQGATAARNDQIYVSGSVQQFPGCFTVGAGMFAYYDKFKEDRESKSVNTKEEAV